MNAISKIIIGNRHTIASVIQQISGYPHHMPEDEIFRLTGYKRSELRPLFHKLLDSQITDFSNLEIRAIYNCLGIFFLVIDFDGCETLTDKKKSEIVELYKQFVLAEEQEALDKKK